MLAAETEDLAEHAQEYIKHHDLKKKTESLARAEDLMNIQRATPSQDETRYGNAVTWSSYYIADHYQLSDATMTFQATV